MAERKTKIYKIALHHLEEKGRKLAEYAQEHPTLFGLISVTIVGGVVAFTLPAALGFSATGPVAGSIAAAWQSSLGHVTANSFFALLQSMAMSGTFETIGISLFGTAAVVSFVEWSRGVEFTELITGWLSFTKSIGFNPESIEWSKGEQLVQTIDWEGAANDVAGSVDRAVQEALKHAAWVGENLQGVDWSQAGDEAVRGAGFVMHDVVQGAGWAMNEAAQMVGMVARGLL